MDPTREHEAERIFIEAFEQAPRERTVFVERACGSDLVLRSRVESLLHAYEQGQIAYATDRVHERIQAALDSATRKPARRTAESLVGRQLSHYRIIEKIGEGGMGVVWRAEDTVLHRPVAIKVLSPDLALNQKRRRMFSKEARLAASLSHSNIVQVHELGKQDEIDFIVMEHVEGQPLLKIIDGKPLPPEKVVDIGLQVAQGLARAHRNELIHRDLKPANILVTSAGEVKIVDFGLATLYTTPISSSGTLTIQSPDAKSGTAVFGTLPYMSPEQLRRETLDARSDIFSLGIVLYEMTTGRRPFTGTTPKELANGFHQGPSRPVHELAPNVPLELERIIDKTLSPAQEDRYQTMDDLAVDLRRLRRQLRARTTLSYGVLRQAQRDRRIAVWSLGVTVAMLALAAVFVVQAWLGGRENATVETLKPSLLILPFKNHGPPEDGYIVEHLVKGLDSQLSRMPELAVVSRAAVRQYHPEDKSTRQIAGDFHAEYVLQGSVRPEQRNDSVEEFSTTLELAAGDHVDFSVGDGGNGNNSDSSGLSVRLEGPQQTLRGTGRTYDAFEDFSLDRNGPWTYGYTEGLRGDFKHELQTVQSDSFLAWQARLKPSMARNISGHDIFSHGGVLLEASEFLHIHPGPRGEHAVIRFTAPASGQYKLHARFKNARVGGPPATTDVHVLLSGRSLYDGVINIATNVRWLVTTELVRARDERRTWTQEYECRSRDLGSVSTRVAAAVIDQLGIDRPEGGGPAATAGVTTSVPAHLAFVRGQRLVWDLARLDPDSWSLAIHLFERALEHDPNFIRAQAELARAHAGFLHWRWDRSPERLQRAQTAAGRAAEIDSTAPEAKVALGYYHGWGTGNLDLALEAFESAKESWPDSAIVLLGIGEALARRGEFGRSVETLETAVRSQPESAFLLYRLAETYSFVCRYREAESALTQVTTIAFDAPIAHLSRANNALLQGQLRVAQGYCKNAPDAPRTEYASMPCLLRYHGGEYDEALALARKLPGLQENQFDVVSRPLMMATIYEAMGEPDSAMTAWSELLPLVEERIRADSANAALHSALGLAFAGIGHAEEAKLEGLRAIELTAGDLWERPARIYELAQIYLLVGDLDAAVAQLERLIPMANNMVARNLLRYSPMFAPIREHPRFPHLLGLAC